MSRKNKIILQRVIASCVIMLLVGFALGMFVGKLSVNVHAEIIEPIESSEPIEEEPILVQAVTEVISTPTPIPIGICKVSAYCLEDYPHICNNGSSKTTATGTVPTVGRTIAVDPKVIPYGSEVIINGHTYIAEDCGGAIKGNRVDILFATHKEALNFGIQYAEVSFVPKAR